MFRKINYKFLILLTFFAIGSNKATENWCCISDKIDGISLIYASQRFSGEATHNLTGRDLINVVLKEKQKKGIYVFNPPQIRENKDKNPNYDIYNFNASSTIFTAVIVFDMWKKDLEGANEEDVNHNDVFDEAMKNLTTRKGLFIFPHEKSSQVNAFYTPGDRTLRFNFLPSLQTFMCQIFDVVSHETGHAFLDTVQPKFNSVNTLWNGSFHESFGDISAIMASMEIALDRFKFNEVSSFILDRKPLHIAGPSIIGCIRKPSEYVGISIHEIHETSNIFTKAFFESLQNCYIHFTKHTPNNLRLVLSAYRKALLEAAIYEKSINNGNNDLLINISKAIIENLKKYLKLSFEFSPILLQPFMNHFDGLTHAIIFDPKDMESFGVVPVPIDLDPSNSKFYPIM